MPRSSHFCGAEWRVFAVVRKQEAPEFIRGFRVFGGVVRGGVLAYLALLFTSAWLSAESLLIG